MTTKSEKNYAAAYMEKKLQLLYLGAIRDVLIIFACIAAILRLLRD